VPAIDPRRFRSVISPSDYRALGAWIDDAAAVLHGRAVWNVNSMAGPEARWKRRPVVASRIGGIQDQIVDGESGVLVSDPRDLTECGSAVSRLLADPERASRIGLNAHARIRDHFLPPHHLGRYFELIQQLDRDPAAVAVEVAPERSRR
jgi:hypothetical protein